MKSLFTVIITLISSFSVLGVKAFFTVQIKPKVAEEEMIVALLDHHTGITLADVGSSGRIIYEQRFELDVPESSTTYNAGQSILEAQCLGAGGGAISPILEAGKHYIIKVELKEVTRQGRSRPRCFIEIDEATGS